jgi:hypothetical protein
MDYKQYRNQLEAYITSLSEEEREQHKCLIDECRARDTQIGQYYEQAMNSVDVFDRLQKNMVEMLMDLETAGEHLLNIHAELYLRLLDRKTMHS